MLFCFALEWGVNLIKTKAMKRIIIISTILFTCIGLFSQPTLQWAKIYNGIDTSGTGNSDIITIKYDPNGNVIWSKVLSLGSGDSPYKIGTDNNNDIIIVGYTYSVAVEGFVANFSDGSTRSGKFIKAK
jgi:hypothetical protein